MKIFITNDDGHFSKGIRVLAEIAKEFGEVYVVGPEAHKSGQSHAITLTEPLRFHFLRKEGNVNWYSCNGTPVDCVKLGKRLLFEKQHPDLLLSGINHGSNASINVIYSGTMGAVREGAMDGIPSIGFSILSHDPDADFQPAVPTIRQIIQKAIEIIQKEPERNICWNVNIPDIPHIQGCKTTFQAAANWREDACKRSDPNGHDYYWLEGDFKKLETRPDSDLDYLDQGYVTIVPIHFDHTDYGEMEKLKTIF